MSHTVVGPAPVFPPSEAVRCITVVLAGGTKPEQANSVLEAIMKLPHVVAATTEEVKPEVYVSDMVTMRTLTDEIYAALRKAALALSSR